MKNKYFLHIDGDAFFASCEVARLPQYLNKPLVVGEERGIATALTYAAKKMGVKRGDPIFKIKREFTNVKVLSGHFELYNKYSYNLINILKRFTDKVEAYSIDECFLTFEIEEVEAEKLVQEIKNTIQDKLGITYSLGFSTTKTLAKIASKINKPNGLSILIKKEEINNALRNTEVGEVWGIGRAIETTLLNNKILTAYDFINSDLEKILKEKYTKPVFITKQELLENSLIPLNVFNKDQKMIQATRAFNKKSKDKNFIFSEISKNLEIACGQLREKKLYTDKVSFYIKNNNLYEKNIYTEVKLKNFTQSHISIIKNVEQLFDKLKLDNVEYKGTGVTLSNLVREAGIELDLFGENLNTVHEEKTLNEAIDKIKSKYGFNSINLVSSINSINTRIDANNKIDNKDEYEYLLPFPFLGTIV
jgi:nucleotidyltransferase/DNA polymerase involved in DNA repair